MHTYYRGLFLIAVGSLCTTAYAGLDSNVIKFMFLPDS
jgi:hypothetical protein